MSSINAGTINEAAKGNEPLRVLLNAIAAQIQTPGAPPLLEPTSGGKTLAPVQAVPPQASINVTGKSGVFTIQISASKQTISSTLFHEVSYSATSNFANATALPLTSGTMISFPAADVTLYWRVRSSYDQVRFNAYRPLGTAVSSGLVESAVMAPAAAFNQTNFAEVNSQATGATAAVTINGTGGPLTSYPAIKGAAEAIRPSATIVGVTPGSDQFVAWDGETFQLKPTLANVFTNGLEPVGKVSVVSTAAPTLPVITPIVTGGGVVGFNVNSGGAGASQPYTLTFATTGGGVGATFGAQVISGGVLLSVAPGNAGSGYSTGTTVVASGGTGGGTPGGGTASGGNGGRLTAV